MKDANPVEYAILAAIFFIVTATLYSLVTGAETSKSRMWKSFYSECLLKSEEPTKEASDNCAYAADVLVREPEVMKWMN